MSFDPEAMSFPVKLEECTVLGTILFAEASCEAMSSFREPSHLCQHAASDGAWGLNVLGWRRLQQRTGDDCYNESSRMHAVLSG